MRPHRYLSRKQVAIQAPPDMVAREDGSEYMVMPCLAGGDRHFLLYEDNIYIAIKCFQADEGDILEMLAIPGYKTNSTQWRVIGCIKDAHTKKPYYYHPEPIASRNDRWKTTDVCLATRPEKKLACDRIGSVYERPQISCHDKDGQLVILHGHVVDVAIHGFNCDYGDWIRLFSFGLDWRNRPLWAVVARLS